MDDAPAVRLAVAVLSEWGGAASAYRRDPNQPLQAYCLIRDDDHTCRVTLYLENGRAPAERLSHGGFYYEGELGSNAELALIGPFNPDDGGEGRATTVLPGNSLSPDRQTPITLVVHPFSAGEPDRTPVLAGELVWLQTQPIPYPEEPLIATTPVDPLLSEAPLSDSTPDNAAPTDRSKGDTTSRDTAPADTAPAATVPDNAPEGDLTRDQVLEPVGVAPVAGLAPMAGASPAATITPEALSSSQAKPAPEPPDASPEPAPTLPASDTPAPPAPVAPILANQAILNVPLTNRHPLAPRAVGSATLELRNATVTIAVRGLPIPAALGRESTTDRPYSAYRVWLLHHRTGARVSLGLCTRIWGENYRFQGVADTPLSRYDAVLITADDRTAPSANPYAPQVLLGTYRTG